MKSRFRDWGDIRLFLAVARAGSTLAASKQLGIGQTTVSRRIDALENALGLTLFERDTRGFRLTADGQALLPAAQDLLQSADALSSKASSLRGRSARPIRFTAWDDAMTAALADVFAEFTAGTPGVTFEFLASERLLDLAAGEADIALRLAGSDPAPDLIRRKVGKTNWTYFASQSYADARGLPESIEDLDGHQIVLLSHIPTERRNVRLCENAAELLMLLRSGFGIGPMTVMHGAREPGLVPCFPPPPGSEMDILLLTSPAAYRRPEIRRFMAFAGPHFARLLKRNSLAEGG